MQDQEETGIWYIDYEQIINNCIGDMRYHFVRYFNSKETMLKTWKQDKVDGKLIDRIPKKKGIAAFNANGILQPMDGKMTLKRPKLFDD